MPILMFLRQYGLREYAVTLTVAALAGLGIAVLLNTAPGGTAGSADLKPKSEIAATAPAAPAPVVSKPAAKVHPAARAHPANQQRHARRHHVRASAPAPSPAPAPAPATDQRLVAARTPTPAPKPSYTPPPKPAPVVHKPAPKPKPAPKRSGGGSGQFDDSG